MKIIHDCLICLGSNSEATIHLKNAQEVLKNLFPNIVFGKSILTEAEGDIPQPAYENQAARFQTDWSAEQLKREFKAIELQNGRTPEGKLSGIVPLDIDLLQYDNLVLKPEDMKKSYVKKAVDLIPR